MKSSNPLFDVAIIVPGQWGPQPHGHFQNMIGLDLSKRVESGCARGAFLASALRQGGCVLYQKRLGRLNANTSLNLPSGWVEKVDYAGDPPKLVIQT